MLTRLSLDNTIVHNFTLILNCSIGALTIRSPTWFYFLVVTPTLFHCGSLSMDTFWATLTFWAPFFSFSNGLNLIKLGSIALLVHHSVYIHFLPLLVHYVRCDFLCFASFRVGPLSAIRCCFSVGTRLLCLQHKEALRS